MKTMRNVLIFAMAMTILLLSLPMAVSAATPKAPINATYERTSATNGLAEGTITVTLPTSHDATSVCIWWANERGRLEDYAELANIDIASTDVTVVEFDLRANTFIPPEATKLMVLSQNETGYSNSYVMIDLPAGAAYNVSDGGKLVTEFHMISDTHVGRTDTDTNGRFKNVLETISEKFSDSKAIFVIGDAVDRGGYVDMWATFWNTYDAIEGLPFMYIGMGNHEGYDLTGAGKTRAMFLRNLRLPDGYEKPDEVYYDVWVDGMHFIMLGDTQRGSLEATIGDAQFAWLEQKLKESDKDEPVFLMLHQGTYETSDVDKLKNVLQKNPNIVMFYGHTHYGILSDNGGLVSGGGLFQSAVFDTSTAGRTSDRSQGYYVQVYENRILVRGYDFLTSKWIPNAQYVLLERYTTVDDQPVNDTLTPPADNGADASDNHSDVKQPSASDDAVKTAPSIDDQVAQNEKSGVLSKFGCQSDIQSVGFFSLCLLGAVLLMLKKTRWSQKTTE